MKYKVGDVVGCEVEVRSNGKRCVLVREPVDDAEVVEGSFQIIGIYEDLQAYAILIEDDMIGWVISEFHTTYHKFPKKLLGKKYFDVTDSVILRKVR